ncbi:hypothetical protein Micbo1qcDRAFT_129057, partial [Microdochium bolleyi]
EEICGSGDVILLIGPHQAPLKVQSRCLRTASKVFDAMFGPNWNEGQDLSEDMPKPVELGDDDFGAMHTVCCVIHHRNDLLTQTLDPADVLRVAVVVDKYDLGVAMKFALAPWLKLRDDINMIQLGYMMAATYRLRDKERFVGTTLALILCCDASYWCLSEHETISESLRSNTDYTDLLEERRNHMRADILSILRSRGPDCSCGWGNEHAQGREELRGAYGPLDLLKTPLSQIINKLESIPLGNLSRLRKCKKLSGKHQPRENEAPKGKIALMKRSAAISFEDQ